MLREVWQALNCLSIHATYCVIVVGASPGETKMLAAVRENGDFFTFVDHVKTNKHMFEFFSPSVSHTILVYISYTDTKHRAASLRQQSFLFLFHIFDSLFYSCINKQKCIVVQEARLSQRGRAMLRVVENLLT